MQVMTHPLMKPTIHNQFQYPSKNLILPIFNGFRRSELSWLIPPMFGWTRTPVPSWTDWSQKRSGVIISTFWTCKFLKINAFWDDRILWFIGSTWGTEQLHKYHYISLKQWLHHRESLPFFSSFLDALLLLELFSEQVHEQHLQYASYTNPG